MLESKAFIVTLLFLFLLCLPIISIIFSIYRSPLKRKIDYLICGFFIILISGSVLVLIERVENISEKLKNDVVVKIESYSKDENFSKEKLTIFYHQKKDLEKFLDYLALLKIFLMFVGGSVGASMISYALTTAKDEKVIVTTQKEKLFETILRLWNKNKYIIIGIVIYFSIMATQLLQLFLLLLFVQDNY